MKQVRFSLLHLSVLDVEIACNTLYDVTDYLQRTCAGADAPIKRSAKAVANCDLDNTCLDCRRTGSARGSVGKGDSCRKRIFCNKRRAVAGSPDRTPSVINTNTTCSSACAAAEVIATDADVGWMGERGRESAQETKRLRCSDLVPDLVAVLNQVRDWTGSKHE